MTRSWQALFDRAAEYEVTVDDVREALAAARTALEADGDGGAE